MSLVCSTPSTAQRGMYFSDIPESTADGQPTCNRCLAVADAYVNMDRVPESMALNQRANAHCVQAKRILQSLQSFSPDALLSVTFEELASLESHIRNSSMKARAAYTLAHGWDGDTATRTTSQIKTQVKPDKTIQSCD